MRDHLHVRVQVADPVARRLDLLAADVLRPVEHLALQVRRVDDVELDDAEPADARGGEVEPDGRAEPARADHEDARGLEPPLPLDPDLGDDEVAAVAEDLLLRERRRSSAAGRPIGIAHPPAMAGTTTISAPSGDGRLEPLLEPDVLVVQVEDDVGVRLALRVAEPGRELGEAARHVGDDVADGGAARLVHGLAARGLREHGGEPQGDGHRRSSSVRRSRAPRPRGASLR